MATTIDPPTYETAPEVAAWKMHARGIWAAFSIALRRLAWSKFMIANYILTGLPLALMALVTYNLHRAGAHEIARVHETYEAILRTLYIHFVVFFLANTFGFAVVRQEVEGQTLHYLLLQPVRRWALFLGRYLAYLTLVSAFCIASLWIAYFILALGLSGWPAVVQDLFGAGRFVILLKESGVLVLGLMVYGAVAMLFGSIFKSGAYMLLLVAWEWLIPYLPQVLKEWTVLFYLQSLLPEKPPQDMLKLFELLGDPASTLHALMALGAIGAIGYGAAMTLFHFRECQYTDS